TFALSFSVNTLLTIRSIPGLKKKERLKIGKREPLILQFFRAVGLFKPTVLRGFTCPFNFTPSSLVPPLSLIHSIPLNRKKQGFASKTFAAYQLRAAAVLWKYFPFLKKISRINPSVAYDS